MQPNENKAALYDQYVQNGSRLEREVSKLKSDYVTNIPPHIQEQIDKKKEEIIFWENKLKELYT